MTKTEFLSASLPYKIHLSRDGKKDGGRLRDIRVSNVIDLNGCRLTDRYSVRVGSKSIYYNNIENYIPIVRSLTDLTKPIVQADYNDGKPFVAIVELAKIAFGDISVIETKSKKNISGIRFVDEDSDTCVLAYHHETGSFGANVEILEKTENEFINVYYQIELFQHLLKWHFDLITEDCEKVYVTDEFNPYK